MLVKNIQVVNELDTKITDLIEQLNGLFVQRLEIITDFDTTRTGVENEGSFSGKDIDLSTIDLSLD